MKALLVLSFLAIGATPGFSAETPALPYMRSSDFTPVWKIDAEGVATVNSIQFKNQSNREITDQNMKGHISLVNFFFTSCGSTCPVLMNQVQELQKKLPLGAKIKTYSISVTPDQDTPVELSKYAKTRGFDLKNWHLVTGSRSDIFRLGRTVFRADRNPDGTTSDSQFIHTQAIYLVDPDLRVRGVYQSNKPSDMALLLKDAERLSKGS